MVWAAFAARVGHPSTRPAGPWTVTVTNPYTGKPLALAPDMIQNIVEGVAAVVLETGYSGRRSKIKPGCVELINPHTGNTFQVRTSAILKENT